MNEQDYLQGVLKTWNFKERTLTPEQIMLDNAAMGLAGESGEFLDEVKKWCHHGVPMDRDRIMKELGDIRYYYTICYFLLETDDEEIKRLNHFKLAKRYPDGFVDGGGLRDVKP